MRLFWYCSITKGVRKLLNLCRNVSNFIKKWGSIALWLLASRLFRPTCISISMPNRRVFKQEKHIADNIQAERVKLMLFRTNLDPTTTSQGALAIISYTIQNESGTNRQN